MNDLFLKAYVKLSNLVVQEDGQDLVEYALVLTLIAMAAVTAVGSLGQRISNTYNTIF